MSEAVTGQSSLPIFTIVDGYISKYYERKQGAYTKAWEVWEHYKLFGEKRITLSQFGTCLKKLGVRHKQIRIKGRQTWIYQDLITKDVSQVRESWTKDKNPEQGYAEPVTPCTNVAVSCSPPEPLPSPIPAAPKPDPDRKELDLATGVWS